MRLSTPRIPNTRLGAIDNPSGLSPADFASSLASALGFGNVSVRFEKGQTTNLTPTLSRGEGVKILRNGHLYINHNGEMYHFQGAKVK